MAPSAQLARAAKPAPQPLPIRQEQEALKDKIVGWLDDAKASDITVIDLAGKSTIADFMVIATGQVNRHVGAIAQKLQDELKKDGRREVKVEGLPQCDWVLIDAGSVIVHVFRPEVREFYNLEKMWSGDRMPEQPLDS